MTQTPWIPRRMWLFAAAAVLAAVGTQSLHPRELYNQMYPVEALKRDAFHICNDANPTFIRAVRADREACYNSMPHIIAVALGRIRPSDATALAALLDPSRQAEFLLALAAMPPRQPVTAPRSFDNTSWLRSLAGGCNEKNPVQAAGRAEPAALPAPQGKGSPAAIDRIVTGNLPPLQHAAKGGVAGRQDMPPLPLARAGAAPAAPLPAGAPVASIAPLPSPDLGDEETPAIVPVAPTAGCGV